MNRRDFVFGTCAAGLTAAALQGNRRAGATGATRRPPRRLIVVFVAGGWDTSYAVAPVEWRRGDF